MLEIIDIIEKAFEQNPNQPIGDVVILLRQNPEYKKLLIAKIFANDNKDFSK